MTLRFKICQTVRILSEFFSFKIENSWINKSSVLCSWEKSFQHHGQRQSDVSDDFCNTQRGGERSRSYFQFLCWWCDYGRQGARVYILKKSCFSIVRFGLEFVYMMFWSQNYGYVNIAMFVCCFNSNVFIYFLLQQLFWILSDWAQDDSPVNIRKLR